MNVFRAAFAHLQILHHDTFNLKVDLRGLFTSKVHEHERPLVSVAVKVTAVSPGGKRVPFGGNPIMGL